MKKFVAYILCFLMITITFVGCTNHKNIKHTYDDAIRKILTPKIYTDDDEKNEKKYEEIFKEYLSNDTLKKFKINTILVMYNEFF